MFSQSPYNHLAISLDPELRDVYGFVGRNGGLVVRSGLTHFPDGDCAILKKRVEDEQFEKVKEMLKAAWKNRTRYRYNHLGVIVLAFIMAPLDKFFGLSIPQTLIRKIFNQPFKRTCGSFVGVILHEAGIILSEEPIKGLAGTYSPYLVGCSTFREPELVGCKLLYEGRIQDLAGEHKRAVFLCSQY
ncbi:MAG: hypothetical protein ACM3UW_01595 [Bacillota bacterium]